MRMILAICLVLLLENAAIAQHWAYPTIRWNERIADGEFSELRVDVDARIRRMKDLNVKSPYVVLYNLKSTELELAELDRILKLDSKLQDRIASAFKVMPQARQLRSSGKVQQFPSIEKELDAAINELISILGQDCLTVQRAMRERDLVLFWAEKDTDDSFARRYEWYKRNLGIHNYETDVVIKDLARYHATAGDLAKCIELERQSLEFYENMCNICGELRSEHDVRQPKTGNIIVTPYHVSHLMALRNVIDKRIVIAKYLISSNEVGKALELLEPLPRWIETVPKNAPLLSLQKASLCLQVARARYELWEFDVAKDQLQRAIRLLANEEGKRYHSRELIEASIYNNLAQVHFRLEEYEDAAQRYRSLRQRYRNFDRQHNIQSGVLYRLAVCEIHNQQFASAVHVLEELVELHRATTDEFSFSVFDTLDLLCHAMCMQGQPDDAIRRTQSLMKEFQLRSTDDAESIELFKQAKVMKRIALAHHFAVQDNEEQYGKAREVLALAFRIMQEYLSRELLSFAEADAVSIYDELHATMGHLLYFAEDDSPREQLKRVLQTKGLISQLIAHRYQRLNQPKYSELHDQVQVLQNRLEAQSFLPGNQALVYQLEADMKALFRQLLNDGDKEKWIPNAEQIVDDLARRLPQNTAIVEFVNMACPPSREHFENYSLTAFIIRKNHSGELDISRIDLGDARPIDAAARVVAGEFVPADRLRGVKSSKPKRANFFDNRHKLQKLVWAKIAPSVVGCNNIIICPDGSLSLVPFGVLPGIDDEKKYLIQQHLIHYVDSARDVAEILKTPVPRSYDGRAFVGDIDFGAVPQDPLAVTIDDALLRGGWPWRKLHGAARELADFRDAWSEEPVAVLSGDRATERTVLKMLSSVGHAQIGTHGYLNTELGSKLGMGRNRFKSRNPFANTGLVLSNANSAFGKSNETLIDQSFLSALEILSVDLRNLDLAVLSTCHAGGGSLASGDSPFGIQKALRLSGVRTSISNMFAAEDSSTVVLMRHFNQALVTDPQLSKAVALRNAQLKLIDSEVYSHPRYWAGWLLYGDWR